VDRAAWFTIDESHRKINPAQGEFLRELVARRSERQMR
jgi:predicted NUDIX family NTP pyrophosphohydrolase